MVKWKPQTLKLRRVVAYALNVLCDKGYKDICRYLNNVSSACCAGLSQKGFETVMKDGDLKEFL